MVRDTQRGCDGRRGQWHDRNAGFVAPEEDMARARNCRPMGVYEALRHVAKVPLKHFYLATILEDGRPVHFSSKPGPFEKEAEGFFSEKLFLRRYEGAPSPTQSDSLGPASPIDSPYFPPANMFGFEGDGRVRPRRQMHPFDAMPHDDYYMNQPHYAKARKGGRGQRFRGGVMPFRDDDESGALMIATPTKRRGIKLGDSQELWDFYDSRFKSCQQSACKIIAKAWVKAIAPKKQTNNPYTGGEMTAPSWWPKPMDHDKVRHREPDHLYKKERVYLLNHLLRFVMDPSQQNPEVVKLGLSISKLEEVTTDAMAPFYSDTQNPTNASKKQYLDELFKVAKLEERYRHGEIDADTEVYVVADDGQDVPDGSQSDTDDTPIPSLHAPRSRDSPLGPAPRMQTSAIPMQALLHQPVRDHGAPPTSMPMPSGSYLEMPSRSLPSMYPGPTHPLHSDVADLPPHPSHHYVDSSTTTATTTALVPSMPPPPLHTIGDVVSNSLASRRPPILSPNDYQSPTAMYGGGSWPPTTTTSSAPPAIYSFAANPHGHSHGHSHAPQPHSHHSPAQPHSPFTAGVGGQFMASSFDGLPPYDPQSGDPIFRQSGPLPPPPYIYRSLGEGEMVKPEGYSPNHHPLER